MAAFDWSRDKWQEGSLIVDYSYHKAAKEGAKGHLLGVAQRPPAWGGASCQGGAAWGQPRATSLGLKTTAKGQLLGVASPAAKRQQLGGPASKL